MSKTSVGLIVSVLVGASIMAQEAGTASPRKAAIIVENRAGREFNDKVPVLEDLLTSRIAGQGFSVLARDVVTRALNEYPVHGEKPAPADAPGKQLDAALENSTTALRLAQNLGADFILIPSITTFGHERKSYSGNGVATDLTVYTLRVSYKLVEAGEGGALRGATVVASKAIRQSEGLHVETSDVVNELLADAAGQLADAVVKSSVDLPKVTPAAMVRFSVACTMTDLKEQPITVPNLQLNAENRVARGSGSVEVEPLDVTVELDGVALGSAPGSFEARPGLHKLRLSREGFKDWERTINVMEGQQLRVALQMSDAGYARWKDNMAFLQALESDRKLTDAEVKRIEGIAKFFSESHYRVDTKENIKIYKSVY